MQLVAKYDSCNEQSQISEINCHFMLSNILNFNQHFILNFLVLSIFHLVTISFLGANRTNAVGLLQ